MGTAGLSCRGGPAWAVDPTCLVSGRLGALFAPLRSAVVVVDHLRLMLIDELLDAGEPVSLKRFGDVGVVEFALDWWAVEASEFQVELVVWNAGAGKGVALHTCDERPETRFACERLAGEVAFGPSCRCTKGYVGVPHREALVVLGDCDDVFCARPLEEVGSVVGVVVLDGEVPGRIGRVHLALVPFIEAGGNR